VKKKLKWLLVAVATLVAGYGIFTATEPANYVLWALIFWSLLLTKDYK